MGNAALRRPQAALALLPACLPKPRPVRAEEEADDNFLSCTECVRNAARVFCGGEHTLVRNPQTMELYQLGACGLGFDHDEGASAKAGDYLKRVPLSEPALGVFPGYYHNFIKTTRRCFAYGCGRQAPNDGQLMNGSLSEDTFPTATEVRFAEAAAGGHHSICRTRNGDVWASGAGWQGQMGNGGLQYKNQEPQKVGSLPRISRIATGYYHLAALAEDGQWFVWGCNEQLQLAPSLQDEAQIKTPQALSKLLPELKDANVISIEGGYGHTVLLTKEGTVYTLGNHSEGQRGLDADLDEAPPLTAVEGLPGPAQAAVAGSHHTLVICEGRAYGFGSDEFGQVRGKGEPPDDEDQRVCKPHAISGLPEEDPVVRVDAGICHSAAQTASGRIFLWGCGGNGQTGDRGLPASSRIREVQIADLAKQCKQSSK